MNILRWLKGEKRVADKALSSVASQVEPEIAELYDRFPDLKVVENNGCHRLNQRLGVLKYARRQAVGAEIGVFTGLFSKKLSLITKPKQLFLVDPWQKLHGEEFPNWGQYSSNLRLPTVAARNAAEVRARNFKHSCEVVEEFGADWLNSFDEPFLDWVYLDAKHTFEAVIADLRAIDKKLRPDGVIMGDDCWVHENLEMSSVFLAIQRFVSETGYQIIHMSNAGQWAIVRATSLKPPT